MSLRNKFRAAFKNGIQDSMDMSWGQNRLPFGIIAVDNACYGGPAEGRVHEIFGEFSTGKTLLLYQWLINCQKLGAQTFLGEAEGAFSPDLFLDLGGIYGEDEPNGLLVKPLDTVEEFFAFVNKVAEIAAGSDVPIAFGLDSLAALATNHLMEQGTEGSRDMTKAFIISQGTAWIKNKIRGSRIAVVATNQTRIKIGAKKWEDTHTPGGKSWPFYCSLRIELKYDGGPVGSQITHDETKDEQGNKQKLKSFKIGRAVKGEVVKSKLGSPWRQFQLSIYTEADFPHPCFPGHTTRKGIDIDEALLTYYLSNTHAYWGENREHYMTRKGAGRITLHPDLFGEQKSFTKKQWKEVLEEFPDLRNPQLGREAKVKKKPPPPPKKKAKKKKAKNGRRKKTK